MLHFHKKGLRGRVLVSASLRNSDKEVIRDLVKRSYTTQPDVILYNFRWLDEQGPLRDDTLAYKQFGTLLS